MIRTNPFEDIERMFERMNRLVSDETAFPFGETGGVAGVSVDVADYDDEIVVVADLPGFSKAEIDVTVSDDLLTIEADRTTESADESGVYVRRERREESVRRTIRLPATVDDGDAGATYRNGVLTVTLPKLGGESSHRIDVN